MISNYFKSLYFHVVNQKIQISKPNYVKITAEKSENLDFYFDEMLMVEFQIMNFYLHHQKAWSPNVRCMKYELPLFQFH